MTRCAARWSLWWTPCLQDHANLFDIDLPLGGSLSEHPTLQVLRHSQICSPRMQSDVAFCIRSAVLKLQDVCTGKLLTAAFLVPTARLLTNRHETHVGSVVAKLALLLELGMLLGPSLPILVPLLCMAVLSERLLAAVAWHRQALKVSSQSGNVQVAMKITFGCSVLLHIAFASGDTLAVALLSLMTILALTKELPLLMASIRLWKACLQMRTRWLS